MALSQSRTKFTLFIKIFLENYGMFLQNCHFTSLSEECYLMVLEGWLSFVHDSTKQHSDTI